ncbi:MAG: tetratricopeptide repeat protein [Myxococcota bacterium]|nr:tetratricopeptide repeat protein [Myxococcota bacterium]
MEHAEDIEKWLSDAAQKIQEKDTSGAEKLYERILRIQSDHQDALISLGMLYVATGRGPLALKKLQESQKENPESSGPYRAIGTIIRISGHLGLGERFFLSKIDSAGPAKPFVMLSLAEIYAAMGQKEELIGQLKLLQEFPSTEPFSQALLWMEASVPEGMLKLASQQSGSLQKTLEGMAAEIQSDWEKAAQLYFEASRMGDPTWYSLTSLGALWLSSGHLDNCKRYLEVAEKEAPNVSELQLTRARYLAAQGYKEDARLLLQKIAESPGNFMRTKQIAKALLQQIASTPT